MSLAPIALFVYARPWHTRQTVEALQRNMLASKSELFIFSDAPKNEKAAERVAEVRRYIRQINGFKKTTLIERPENFGLARSFIEGNSELLTVHERMIGLEDDNLTSHFFLTFMNAALEMYDDEPDVVCVSGYSYPLGMTLPETYFLRGADTWSYGTWRRGWSIFERDARKLRETLVQNDMMKGFSAFQEMLDQQIAGKIDSWGVRWMASAFANNKYTLYPGRSLVKNIGCDGTGRHYEYPDKTFDTDISDGPISLERQKVQEYHSIRQAFDALCSKQPTVYQRLIKRFSKVAMAVVRR